MTDRMTTTEPCDICHRVRFVLGDGQEEPCVCTAPKYALLLDTETTDVDPKTGAICIEVAVCLYNIRLGAPIASYASLIHGATENPAQEINGIHVDALVDAPPADRVWGMVAAFAKKAQVAVAYNADFDQKFTPDLGLPWACAMNDFQYPGSRKSRSLVALALSLGLGIGHVHRAAADVDLMARVFTRLAERGLSLPAMFLHALRPKALFVSLAPFDQKDAVKEAGFVWDELVPKQWARKMPYEDAAELPFRAVPWESCKLFISLAPFDQKETVKSHGFGWNDLVPKQWAKVMPAEDARALPFAVREVASQRS